MAVSIRQLLLAVSISVGFKLCNGSMARYDFYSGTFPIEPLAVWFGWRRPIDSYFLYGPFLMWAKSFAGVLGGLLISISVMATFYYTLPLTADARIMIGLILGWIVWAAVMVWSYASDCGKQAWVRVGGLFLVTAGLNAMLVFLVSP
tara:strand:+ start:1774 stop:2214 length:441 start_codon:yes stop_codon:yes gene_type:complete